MRSLRIFTADREPEVKYEFEMSDSSPPYWEDNPLLAPCITNTGGAFFWLLLSSTSVFSPKF